ncbi:MAG TPA: flagellar biosynthesis protein [Clostridiaceae bacterium]|nr:flagellar biosynthesis protein [Clostridiaceae bacterium]
MIYGWNYLNRNFLNNNVSQISGQISRKISEKSSLNTGSSCNISNNEKLNFNNILNDQISRLTGLKFSKHAEMRLRTRNINLSGTQLERISQAVTKAEGKGVKDSLIIVDDIALVVSVKNKTVVTVTDKTELKNNIFTNIDGAVII